MLQLGIRGLGIARFKFNPISWFSKGEPGAWYDPSDFQPNWRRNLLTYSQAIGGTNWAKLTTTPTVDFTVAPDGTTTASVLVGSSGTSRCYTSFGCPVVGTNTFTFSVYLRSESDLTARIGIGSVGVREIATLSVPVTTQWKRFELTTTGTSIDVGAALSSVYCSDGISGNTIYAWGAQLEQSSSASTYQKITDGIQDYYTVQPQPVLFQDSAGTTPVTAVEQPVGLMLDKSRGLVLGAELVTNGDFATDTGWNKGVGVTISGGKINYVGFTTLTTPTVPITILAETWYRLVITGFAYISGGITCTFGGTSTGFSGNVNILLKTTTTASLVLNSAAFEGSIGSITIKQIAGNHAFQGDSTSTPAKRPMLSSRVNLLTKTEDFSDASWAKTSISVAENNIITSTSTNAYLLQTLPAYSSIISFKLLCKIKKTVESITFPMLALNLTGGTTTYGQVILDTNTGLTQPRPSLAGNLPVNISSVDKGSYWEVSYSLESRTGNIAGNFTIYPAASSDGSTFNPALTGSVTVYGADLRPTNAGALLPPYQRVNTASDYDTVGFPLYLKANGTSSAMSTNSIDFTSTDKMTVVTGVRKLSDAVLALVTELGVGPPTGSFWIAAPQTVNVGAYNVSSTGSTFVAVGVTGYVSPINNIVTCQASISTPLVVLRVNGNQGAISSATQGSGNFGNYPLYLFSRGGTQYFLNGQFYGAIIRGAQSDTASVTQTEQYMATKTGITF
jgi:hypothetical protein